MKLILFLFLLVSLSAQSQGTIPYAKIEKAFKMNQAKEIVSFGKDKMLISILGKEGVYSKSQATLVLGDFFNRKPGNKFQFHFKSKESTDGSFAIGKYFSKGEEFRITIHFQKIGNSFKIESLTIERA